MLWRMPTPLPLMARAQYPRELRAWTLLGLAIGAVEGGVVGVLLKNGYADLMPAFSLNLAVALATGAPALANVVSLFWAGIGHGRDKARWVSRLALMSSSSLLLIAVAPKSGLGAWLVVAGTLMARVFWCGVITLRSTIWRQNYSREIRARITARLATLVTLVMAGTGLLIGFTARSHPDLLGFLYALLALFGGIGGWRYRYIKVRRQRSLLRQEREQQFRGGGRLGRLFAVIRDDRLFRRYMLWMFIMGSGNLMLPAPLIVTLNDHLHIGQAWQVVFVSALPLAIIPLSLPFWGSYLDTRHIVSFRSVHGWFFVAALGLFAAAGILGEASLLWPAAVLYGTGQAGGLLGWNLGHNDFAPPDLATRYMGVHVSLTGLRGLLMPLVGIGLYQWLAQRWPGSGPWALLLPVTLTTLGALGFVHMRLQLRAASTSDATRGQH